MLTKLHDRRIPKVRVGVGVGSMEFQLYREGRRYLQLFWQTGKWKHSLNTHPSQDCHVTDCRTTSLQTHSVKLIGLANNLIFHASLSLLLLGRVAAYKSLAGIDEVQCSFCRSVGNDREFWIKTKCHSVWWVEWAQ